MKKLSMNDLPKVFSTIFYASGEYTHKEVKTIHLTMDNRCKTEIFLPPGKEISVGELPFVSSSPIRKVTVKTVTTTVNDRDIHSYETVVVYE